MQLLFLFLFGGVVSFILYLSYDRHVSEKSKTTDEDELEIDLNKYSDLTETEKVSKEETLEKVEVKDKEAVTDNVEVVEKFRARRTKKEKSETEEEII